MHIFFPAYFQEKAIAVIANCSKVARVYSPRVIHAATVLPRPAYRNHSAAIIMSDYRNLTACSNYSGAPYHCYSVAANYLYARRHGYAFTYYMSSWNSTSGAALHLDPPRRPNACFHRVTGGFRHASWCKLLPAWVVASSDPPSSPTGNSTPGWVMYMDSDAVFRDAATGIHEYLAMNRTIELGTPVSNASAVVFFRNLPGVKETFRMPNAGTFLIRPGASSAAFFSYWWAAGPDVGGNFEQESLWQFYSHPQWTGFLSVIASEQFCGEDDIAGQWVRHYCRQRDAQKRSEKLRTLLLESGIDEAEYLHTIDDVIQLGGVVDLDVLEVDAQIVASVDPSGLGCSF